jgi:hypothetical protein
MISFLIVNLLIIAILIVVICIVFLLSEKKKTIQHNELIDDYDCYADKYFDMQNRAENIKEDIIRIREEGFWEVLVQILGQDIIDDLASKDNKSRVSRLIIKDNFNIILADYDNFEIKLTPLPKAVYILYLRHPEGIPFKMLSSYQAELLEIYKNISPRESIAKIEESIELVTDPTKNAINEKCARIKEAFTNELDAHIAKCYYINGSRGEAKRIILDPELIIFPETIHRIPLTYDKR